MAAVYRRQAVEAGGRTGFADAPPIGELQIGSTARAPEGRWSRCNHSGYATPGAQVMKSRERRDWTAPVVSHWGISGGRFPELAGPTAFGFLIGGWNGLSGISAPFGQLRRRNDPA